MDAILEKNDIVEKTMIQESREDAESMVMEVMRKVPENRKNEVARIIEGFALGAAMQEDGKEAV